MNELPVELRGPAQNKHGGHQTQKLRGMGNWSRGGAGPCRSYTFEERERYAQEHGIK